MSDMNDTHIPILRGLPMHHLITVAVLSLGLFFTDAAHSEVFPGSATNAYPDVITSEEALDELEFEIASALERIIRLRRDRDRELGVLYEKQKAAANHLDGDMWLESIALEIQEAAWSYQTRIEEAVRTFDRLHNDLNSLRAKLESVDEPLDER
ncbi:MAG: hypothetical protein AAF756_03685 [Pseudomonadota bacterium]